jgi:hypothetical protein
MPDTMPALSPLPLAPTGPQGLSRFLVRPQPPTRAPPFPAGRAILFFDRRAVEFPG